MSGRDPSRALSYEAPPRPAAAALTPSRSRGGLQGPRTGHIPPEGEGVCSEAWATQTRPVGVCPPRKGGSSGERPRAQPGDRPCWDTMRRRRRTPRLLRHSPARVTLLVVWFVACPALGAGKEPREACDKAYWVWKPEPALCFRGPPLGLRAADRAHRHGSTRRVRAFPASSRRRSHAHSPSPALVRSREQQAAWMGRALCGPGATRPKPSPRSRAIREAYIWAGT